MSAGQQPDVLEQLRSGRLRGSRRLAIAAGLREFPREIFELADTLEILDLSGNALTSLPDDLPRLRRLRVLFCSNNPFTELPAVLGRCPALSMVGFKSNRMRHVPGEALPPHLRWLILTDNQIEQLPPAIGRCGNLQKLMLAGNRLPALPPEMAGCTSLELLRIAANRFTFLPEWLLALPRLSWLAFGGNPLCAASEQAALSDRNVADIAWGQLELGNKLGEGASGHIHYAKWRQDDDERAVAVKLFKGAVTSDGLPDSEMAASVHAGRHANLIAVHGKVVGHPEHLHGLVMDLVETRFRTLAKPPSFETCTRDVYADARFAPDGALHIALGIASAVAHMHSRGILHGDVYAHNTLHDGAGHALLGDCGAASFIPSAKTGLAAALQRIEARAFACLLEELLDRCDWESEMHGVRQELHQLQACCAQELPEGRPLFSEIADTLRVQLGRMGGRKKTLTFEN